MKRTTVVLPDDTMTRLRHESRRRGTSIADIVRVAVERHLADPPEGRGLSFVAVGEGGPEDASEQVDRYVGDAIALLPA
ncbi:MAG: ribbon-helix-helix protein, CopG family [Actinobacteria bacterium]|nr:ribbon-helix-helix protein, CopG family [Actinomycetota bacterium]